MALKFLNKKGWHTGSLRNIENVWKAEQKHDAEQKKLDELRKQIQEERERSEFRLLQEQAGLVPKQERLDFLYDSGLAVGKGSSDGFKPLETFPPKTETEANSSSSKQSSTPGALFEDKPQSANDAWRKLHSDPLLLIRQREQEALARVKNNPIQMAMIRKSVESKQDREKSKKKEHKKHRRKTSKHHKHSSLSKGHSDLEGERSKRNCSSHSKYSEHSSRDRSDSENNASERERRRKRSRQKLKHEKHSSGRLLSETDTSEREERSEKSHHRSDSRYENSNRENHSSERFDRSNQKSKHEPHTSDASRSSNDASTSVHWNKPRRTVSKLSEEERAARLQEMQLDAELHEEQRWKRLKKAADNDTKEASQVNTLGGKTFLDAAHKSVYGAERGGSSTIEESVRRRTYYLQGRSAANEGNAFRR